MPPQLAACSVDTEFGCNAVPLFSLSGLPNVEVCAVNCAGQYAAEFVGGRCFCHATSDTCEMNGAELSDGEAVMYLDDGTCKCKHLV